MLVCIQFQLIRFSPHLCFLLPSSIFTTLPSLVSPIDLNAFCVFIHDEILWIDRPRKLWHHLTSYLLDCEPICLNYHL